MLELHFTHDRETLAIERLESLTGHRSRPGAYYADVSGAKKVEGVLADARMVLVNMAVASHYHRLGRPAEMVDEMLRPLPAVAWSQWTTLIASTSLFETAPLLPHQSALSDITRRRMSVVF